MNKKLRLRILTKLAQTQPAQPTETPAILGPVPNVPDDLTNPLYKGYNQPTAALLDDFTDLLNEALHYASQDKDDFTKIIGNNMDLSGADPDHKNVGKVCDRVFETFLNRKQPFTKKIDAITIKNWADALINSPEYNNLSQVKTTSILGTKIGNLKTKIQKFVTDIKQLNPETP